MPGASIAGIAVHLPAGTLTNEDLAAEFPEWSVDKIAAKTGITSRHVVGPGETTSDLAIAAAKALLEQQALDPAAIDYLLVCTQTPDRLMPGTSLLVHGAIGMRTDAGATDITHGCSGYVYALGLATALIESGQARTIVVVTADTYTRLLNPADKSVRAIFGDGATATLVVAGERRGLHSFVYGSDGSGGAALVVPGGGLRDEAGDYPDADPEARGLSASGYDLYMDGPAIFNFTLRVAPASVEAVLAKAGLDRDAIDTWVFHQANAFMLGHLRRKIGLPEDRFVVDLADTGNTVSSTIPIALSRLAARGGTPAGTRSVLLGFGVGLSWAGAVVDW